MNPPAPRAPSSEVGGRHIDCQGPREGPRGGRPADRSRAQSSTPNDGALNAPNEARAILHIAYSFADELPTLDPDSTACSFIKDVTEDPS